MTLLSIILAAARATRHPKTTARASAGRNWEKFDGVSVGVWRTPATTLGEEYLGLRMLEGRNTYTLEPLEGLGMLFGLLCPGIWA